MSEASPSIPTSLTIALVSSLPLSTYYIPNFITLSEEASLLQRINSVPLPTWHTLSNRRLQAHPSPLSASNTLLDAPLPPWLAEPVVKRLLSLPFHAPSKGASDGEHEEPMAERKHLFSDSPHQVPNHCLINEYLPGQGIHPHEDGGAYAPIVATISLGAPIVLDIFPKPAEGGVLQRNSRPQWRILQEERSLLVSTGEMYTKYLHGIEAVKEDIDLQEVANWDFLGDKERFAEGRNVRRTRVSLTFRDVLKVKKLGKGLDFLHK